MATSITNWTELQEIRTTDKSADYVLENDLTPETNGYQSEVENVNNGFIPIGTSDSPFTGTFDGQGYIIDGLRIDRGPDRTALFGKVENGTVRNVSVLNADISSSGISTATTVGFLAPGGTVENVHADGAVRSDGTGTGVCVGYNRGTVRNCVATGGVKTDDQANGGFVGQMDDGTIEQCISSASVNNGSSPVYGGFVGWGTGGTIRDCASIGGEADGGNGGGGFIGTLQGAEINRTFAATKMLPSYSNPGIGGWIAQLVSGSFNDNYFDREATGEPAEFDDPDLNGLTTSEITGSSAETNLPEFDFGGTWQTVSENQTIAGETANADGYPIIQTAPSYPQLYGQEVTSPISPPNVTVDIDGTTATIDWDGGSGVSFYVYRSSTPFVSRAGATRITIESIPPVTDDFGLRTQVYYAVASFGTK
jgi:hypothetical protein